MHFEEIDGVTGVFLGSNFVSVTKRGGEWQHLTPAVLGAIMEHFLSGEPVLFASNDAAGAGEDFDAKDAEVVAAIKELIETRVRPAVANDGGDILPRVSRGHRLSPDARRLLRLPFLNARLQRYRKPVRNTSLKPRQFRRYGSAPPPLA
jgi:hypothetical protein